MSDVDRLSMRRAKHSLGRMAAYEQGNSRERARIRPNQKGQAEARRLAAIAGSPTAVRLQDTLSDRLVLGPLVVAVCHNGHPDEAAVAPAIEQKTLLKRLALGRNHDVIMLARRSGKGFSPVEFQRLEFQGVQRDEQVFRPLITVAPLSRPRFDKEILQPRRPDHAVFTRQPSRVGVGALG